MSVKRKTRRLSIRFKIIIPSCILLIVLCAVIGWNSCRHIESGMVEMGVEEAKMAANTAVGMVDGELIKVIRPEQESYGSKNFMSMLDGLKKIQETCGIEFIYTLYSDDSSQVNYGVASDDTEDDCSLGEEFESDYSELASVFEGEEYVQDYIDRTEDGNLITAYAPIRDNSGSVVGILGCDYEATNVIDRISEARKNVIVLSAISLVIAIAVLSLIITAIMRNLRRVDNKIYDLVHSEGDLTRKLDIRTGDEIELIADSVNALLEYIREIMVNISKGSVNLNESAGLVAKNLGNANDGITSVSSTMEQMSAAMEETSASLFEVNRTTVSIADTVVSIADRAETESVSSDNISKKVQEIYDNAIRDKEAAAEQAEEMSKIVSEKIESSKAVTQIDALTDHILDITRQTSLLSLNASIEAARAGDMGRGFGVVAGEIGILASNSAEAAEQIQRVSSEVIRAVDDLAKEAERMIRFMNETAMTGFDKLLDNSQNYHSDVKKLSEVMQSFAKDSNHLRENIENIKTAVGEVNTAVEESTQGLTSVTEIAADLSSNMVNINDEAGTTMTVAEGLSDEVGKFKL